MSSHTQTVHIPEENVDNIKTNVRSTLFSWIRFLVLLAVIFFIFRYALGITIINGNSMNPTLHDNDVVLTSNIFYQAERNDIIVIHDENGFNIIKRIIALPNETIEIKNGIVLINGNPLEETYTVGLSNDIPEIVVKEGTYFVIGDNRTPGESLDSRNHEVGLIPIDHTKGKAFFSIKSFQFL